jgi:cytosine/adenosine deaminase-related metal-dependent hydrolase
MNGAHDVLTNGRILVRDGSIVAVWRGATPSGVSTSGARVVRAGLIYPGLINLHDHSSYDVLPAWRPPAAYDYRYEWSVGSPATFERFVRNPHDVLDALGLGGAVLRYDAARAALSGETGSVEADDRIASWVPSIASLPDAAALRQRIAAGLVSAWVVHLAEGVRDRDRRSGDTFSSRAELDTLATLGLLGPATVVVHGTALEPADFAVMAAAGAKLVWSPLSNLRLYGHTTDVKAALAAGVAVSLGTDWTPSGSPTLLDELKVASGVVRDDRLLVDMVTRNPAAALHWDDRGSLEPGKRADVLLLRARPGSPYRALIGATQRDVRLVLAGGRPVAGDVDAMGAAGVERLRSPAGSFTKA